MRCLLIFKILFFVGLAQAKLILPSNLNHSDREKALVTLGSGTINKVLANPYPLGGYSGVEFGVSYDIIPSSSLKNLGSKPQTDEEMSYFNLYIAKGLYYNVDFFVNFSPAFQDSEVSGYGGGMRWMFIEGAYVPVSLSTILAVNATSFQNRINVNTQSADLIATIALEKLRLYFGGGTAKFSGSFVGGASGVTDSGSTEDESLVRPRVLFGFSVQLSPWFVAFETSRSEEVGLGLRLGTRF